MHRILAIALCMLWSVAGLAADAAMPAQSCASLGEATAGPEDNFRPPLEGEVIDKGRAYFHSAPRADCVTGVFVIPGDFITVYKPSGEWLNVMYVARDGKETSGWLLEKRVRLRQAFGGPDEPAQHKRQDLGGNRDCAGESRCYCRRPMRPLRASGCASRQASGAAQAVAAVALGFVERLVDPSQQVVAAFAGPQVGATEADRQLQRFAGVPVVQFLHRLAQAFADHAGSLQRRAGQQDEEFLAAEAEHHVDIAQVVLDGFRHGLEGFVADGVTVVVVDPLEVVDIEHQHRERLQVAPGQFQFAAERLVHGDAVAGAGQGVAQGGLDRGAIEQGVAQREQQGAEQALQLPLFVFAEALAATEDQFAR